MCGLITTERNTPALGKVFMAPFVISKILNIANGEGNGNPLRCSCLENPRDGGALVGCRLWGHTESDTTEVT